MNNRHMLHAIERAQVDGQVWPRDWLQQFGKLPPCDDEALNTEYRQLRNNIEKRLRVHTVKRIVRLLKTGSTL